MKIPFILLLIVVGCMHVASADMQSAENKYLEAQQLSRVGGMDNARHAFELLWKAWDEADSDRQREKIKKSLQKVYNKYCDEVSHHVYCFEDRPNEDDEEFYDMLIRYGQNARAHRLKGILLINRGEANEGVRHLLRAVEGKDMEAPFYIARQCASGKGVEGKSPKLAFQVLEKGISLGSPSANLHMARVLWNVDGTYGAPNNRPQDVAQCLRSALRYMKRWKLYDKDKERERKNSVNAIEYAIRNYFIPWGKNPEVMERAGGLESFQPSFEVLLVDWYNETSIYWIYKTFFPHIGLRPPGASVDLKKISFFVESKHPTARGLCERKYYDDSFVANRITMYRDNFPPAGNTSQQYWWRRINYLNTLVHEMAHVYFSQRYKIIPEFGSDLNCKRTYEGHATNVAYLFIKYHFFRGSLTPKEYAEMFCADEYKTYFFWFRQECMSPGDDVYWNKIDHWEREAARELGYKNYEVKTRTQVPWGGPLQGILLRGLQ